MSGNRLARVELHAVQLEAVEALRHGVPARAARLGHRALAAPGVAAAEQVVLVLGGGEGAESGAGGGVGEAHLPVLAALLPALLGLPAAVHAARVAHAPAGPDGAWATRAA